MSSFDLLNAADWKTVAPLFQALQTEELTGANASDWLRRWSDLERVLDEAAQAASRAKAENTADVEAEKTYLHFIQEIMPQAEIAAQGLKMKLLAVSEYSPARDEVQFLKRLRSEAALFREANVPLNAEIETLANEYDKIVGAMSIEIAGEEITIQQAEQRLLATDRTAREATWRASQKCWLEARPALDALYLQLREKRQQMGRNAGLADYCAFRWEELQRFDYTPEDSLAFGRAIELEIVPLANKRRERRRRQMGLDALRPWDLAVDPLSRPPLTPFQTTQQLEQGAANIFQQIDPELGADFSRLRASFLDLGSRRNKAPGGFCAFFPQTGLPYIFMNAVGTQDDVQTLLHEGGHAFHDLASNASQSLIWNVGAPSEFAEVASMGMELLASPYLNAERGGFYNPEDAERARTEHLEKIIQFLPYMAIVDGFQHWVYAESPADVTAAQMDAQWDALWERFLPGLDWSGLEQERCTGWHRKLHIFLYPFYYVEYGLAQLGALQVWRNTLADPQGALLAYRRALALGNTRPLPKLFEAAGTRLAFDADTMSELAALISAHLKD